MMVDNKQLGCVFPGQGSQSVGMLQDIARSYPVMTDTFAEASDTLGYDLWKLTSTGPKEQLDQTEYTQPALLVASYALFRVIQQETGLTFKLMAGHSLGEYTALLCAGILNFADAVRLVALRGKYMQEAVPEGLGAMGAIIGLSDDVVLEVCNEVCSQSALQDAVLSPANYNSLGQVVVAGHKALVELALQQAKARGAKLATMIPVSVPSHCALMQPAQERLSSAIQALSLADGTVPVVSNVKGVCYTNKDAIKDGLVEQLCKPVQWVKTIETFAAREVHEVLECGPGKVLAGLIKRIDKNLVVHTVCDMNGLLQFLQNNK